MKLEISLVKDPQEIEDTLATSHFDCIEVYEPSSKVEKGGTVYIISEDQPHYVIPATWALGDDVLEDLMEGEKLMKCVILVDKVVMNGKTTTEGNHLTGIKGYCIDYGGENYIVLPARDKKQLQLCDCGDIQNYLVNR
ncbi:hypothetical protein LZ575_03020 [Antarcticibacterium sp. 1MA-6-2]|uniref:hypothetical protein n=1 Tax=Antarcticibacterium sp. 1MA-6-2 TaxID=2908210 RepID=UPI001F21D9D8|nr:hypothetical protein [Antarcticibacterium sp. 1MA-6-2]UJH91674.1 hypothetical protein LZ575_03020 [Antarcticibacterium sp. 1MA-6-2]